MCCQNINYRQFGQLPSKLIIKLTSSSIVSQQIDLYIKISNSIYFCFYYYIIGLPATGNLT